MNIKDLDNAQLLQLREDIVLNSIFLNDYSNRFGINENECINFFDGYVDYLIEEYGDLENALDNDNLDNLINWRYCVGC